MEKNGIEILAEEAIDEYFADIGDTVDKIVESIIDKYGLDEDDLNEEDKKSLKKRILRGILKLDDHEHVKSGCSD